MRVLKGLLLALLLFVVVGCILPFVAIQRGFRASSTPTATEAAVVAVARTLRNFAIPGNERRQKNPLQGNSEALARGREYFMTQCASCHGIDGGGRTRIGTNLYPRVPDLRLDTTQRLTDGEIYYIIENGVQLTGTPAWGSAHRHSGSDSWELVLFIRSLRPITQREAYQQSNLAATVHYVGYVGSQACEKCHQEIYARWKKTPMANVVRDPRAYPHAIIPDLATNTVAETVAQE
jgi:mono/diheme cytochrome c family protein